MSEVTQARAFTYQFLSLFFRPDWEEEEEKFIYTYASRLPETGEEALDRSVKHLKEALLRATPTEIKEEFERLFLDPFEGANIPLEASYYLDGKIYGPTLARLRGFLAELGFAKGEGIPEPEDHLALLLAFMGRLVAEEKGLIFEKELFYNYLRPCVLGVIERLKIEEAKVYAPLGEFLKAFLRLEERYFKET